MSSDFPLYFGIAFIGLGFLMFLIRELTDRCCDKRLWSDDFVCFCCGFVVAAGFAIILGLGAVIPK